MATGTAPKSKYIDFTEEFQRAKRNVLIWSTLTLLASLADTSPKHSISFGPNYGNIEFPSALVVFGLLVITVYMAVGYWFAEDRFMNDQNSEVRLAGEIAETANAAEILRHRIELTNQEVAETNRAIASAKTIEKGAISDAAKWKDVIDSAYDNAIMSVDMALVGWDSDLLINETLKNVGETLQGLVPGDKYSEIDVRAHIHDLAQRYVEAVSNQMQERIRAQAKSVREIPPPEFADRNGLVTDATTSIENLNVTIGQLEKMPEALRKLARAIDRKQLFQLRFYHRGVVWLVVVLAVILAAFRLITPGTVDAGMSCLFRSSHKPEPYSCPSSFRQLLHHPGTSSSATQSPPSPVDRSPSASSEAEGPTPRFTFSMSTPARG